MKNRRKKTASQKFFQYGTVLASFALILTFLVTIRIEDITNRAFNTEFTARAQQVVSLTERHLSDYERILMSLQGLYAVSENVSRADWSDFIRSQKFLEEYPEIRAFEYIEYLTIDEKEDFINRVRDEGFIDFNINPSSDQEDLFVVNYIEPLEANKDAFGYDLGSNPDRRSALEEARDSNSFVLTAPIKLIQQQDSSISFLGVLPIYEQTDISTLQSRRQHIKGYLLVALNPELLFSTRSENSSENLGIDYHIFDAATDDLLHESYLSEIEADHEDEEALFIGHIETGSRNWELHAVPNDVFYSEFRGETILSKVVLGLGASISIAIFIFFMLLDRSRVMAVKLAEKMTRNYKNSEKKVEQTLKKVEHERDNIDTILEEIGDGVFVIDNKKNIFLFNPSAENITGYKKVEVINKPFTNLVKLLSPEKTKAGISIIKKISAFKTTKPVKVMNVITRKDGKKITIAATLTPLIDANNKTIGNVVVFRDVSKEAAVDKVKTEFVSLAAHQLRSPITSIKLGLESILDGDLGKINKKQTSLLSEMSGVSERMGTLVKGFLNVSRLDLGTFPVKIESLDLIKYAKAILKELKIEIATKNLKVKTEFEKIPKIQNDENVIKIILQNLLTNAVKYTPKNGSIHFSIKEKNNQILIQVADSGFGIPEKDQNNVFKKLFRADNIVDKHPGTGLGLYTVKSVVEQSGGKIWFESKENEGSIFYVTLPKKSKAKSLSKK